MVLVALGARIGPGGDGVAGVMPVGDLLAGIGYDAFRLELIVVRDFTGATTAGNCHVLLHSGIVIMWSISC
jgi:hypothetical protein